MSVEIEITNRCAGIILAGGKSRRMGADKASLPFGDETMLCRSIRILSSILSPIVVVAAADQKLPDIPDDVIVVRDREPGRGPMEGVAVGLSQLADCKELDCTAAFVTTCDAPLISAPFILRLMEFADLATQDAVVPIDSERRYPLTAIYGLTALPMIEACVQADKLKVVAMLDELSTCFVESEEFRDVDPELLSLQNINSVTEYEAAVHRNQ